MRKLLFLICMVVCKKNEKKNAAVTFLSADMESSSQPHGAVPQAVNSAAKAHGTVNVSVLVFTLAAF